MLHEDENEGPMGSPASPELTRHDTSAHRRAVARLASLYRSELAATQTYTSALCHESLAFYAAVLRRQKRAHEERLAALAERFPDLGERPPESAGAWGAFIRLVEDFAASVTPEMALAVLAEEEGMLAADYVGSLEILDPASRAVVIEHLLPGQNVTARVVRRIHEQSAA